MPTAFDPVELGERKLTNRIVMSPMTRSRAHGSGNSPTDDVATYYAQRAGAGLLVIEGTQPNVVGQGYPYTPGLHSDVQVEAWQRVTDAVHAEGGVIFAQLRHTGARRPPVHLPGAANPCRPFGGACGGTNLHRRGHARLRRPACSDIRRDRRHHRGLRRRCRQRDSGRPRRRGAARHCDSRRPTRSTTSWRTSTVRPIPWC